MQDFKWKVLVVDDEPNNLTLLGQILQDQYQLSFATDGKKAISAAMKLSPDIILLDVMMPGMNGYEVCRQLKSDDRTAKIPVIFITALGEAQHEQRGFEAGGVDYITKPISGPIVQARVATHLALYDQQCLLEQMVSKRTDELKQALCKIETCSLDSILRLTKAAEFKDEDTGDHILRMSQYSAALARQLGLGEDRVKSILYSSPMHDVGKIGIPDRILLKPDRLDEQEWHIMKQHTLYGGRILHGSKAEYLKLGEIIALSHHERWDGCGYPNGLKEDQIPIEGRIVAVADVFDALTSKRPYKEAFTVEQSFIIMSNGQGKHFDPTVIDAFFCIKNEILSIKEKFKDKDNSLFFQISAVDQDGVCSS